jgi:hypothetical protein
MAPALRTIMVALAVAALATTGCRRSVTPPWISWRGHDIDELIREIGPPSERTTLKDGAEVLVWRSQWVSTAPAFGIVGGWGVGERSVVGGTCTLVVSTDATGVITRARWDNCLRSPLGQPPTPPAPP